MLHSSISSLIYCDYSAYIFTVFRPLPLQHCTSLHRDIVLRTPSAFQPHSLRQCSEHTQGYTHKHRNFTAHQVQDTRCRCKPQNSKQDTPCTDCYTGYAPNISTRIRTPAPATAHRRMLHTTHLTTPQKSKQNTSAPIIKGYEYLSAPPHHSTRL